MEEYTIPIDGGKLVVYCEGEGTPLLLVHGIAVNHDMWKLQLPTLKERYRMVAPDLRGFGQSKLDRPDTPADYTYDIWANDLDTVINELNLQDVTLAGYSLGGAIAMRYVSSPRPAVEKLLLIAAAGPNLHAALPFPDGVRLDMIHDGLYLFSRLIDDMEKEGGDEAFKEFVRFVCPTIRVIDFEDGTDGEQWMRDMFDSSSPQALRGALNEMHDRDLTAGVRTIDKRTRICHGVHDQFVLFALGQLQQRLIAGAELVCFERSGHGIFFEERDLLAQKLAW
jgi:pimeloyl-ACP methyl ester carboxylesterase